MPRFRAVIFDVDGVLVDSPHERAWRESLRELMLGEWRDIRERTTWSPDAFTPQVYQTLVSGKPRMAGARAVLDYFHVPDDEEGSRAEEYAERKQEMVVRLIEAGEFTPYSDALRFVLDLKDAGFRIATASSSKNAHLLLGKIRVDAIAGDEPISSPRRPPARTLRDVVDVDVSGRTFPRGKPDPAMFLAAADELGIAAEECVVVEDAPAGVHAAKAGRMAAIGVARAGDEDLLTAAGADIVVTTLDDVDRAALAAGRIANTKT
jgi:beta-phosphoglucomutase-like phosphatase (HAD superfamily)